MRIGYAKTLRTLKRVMYRERSREICIIER